LNAQWSTRLIQRKTPCSNSRTRVIIHHLFKRGDVWFVDFRFQDHRYKVSTRSRNKGDAQRLAEHIVRQAVEKVMGGAQFKLSELMDRYISYARAINCETWFSQKQCYLKRFAKVIGDRPLSEITPYDCQQFYQTAVNTGVSNDSVNSQMAAIKNMFTMAIEWEMMAKNPMIKIKKLAVKGRQRYLSDDEVLKLLDAARTMAGNERSITQRKFYLFIKTAMLTGMRRGEIVKLRWMDFRDDFINVRDPKERKAKLVPVPPGLKRELLTLNTGQEYIFQGMGREAIRNTWLTICKRAGVRDAHIHDLRHRFASIWAQSGTSLVALQHTLGHSSLAMTAKYAHASDQDQLDAVTKLEARFAGTKVGPSRGRKKVRK
jgi:integrase